VAVEIDNNEMMAWPGATILATRVGVHVHHNHIHHNRRHVRKASCRAYGLGYGISTSDGDVLIEANLFDHNRHDIASDGRPNTIYEARYNLVLDGAVQHSFDIHGFLIEGEEDSLFVAGHTIRIHHNTFLQSRKPAVKVRGVPANGAWIFRNKFLGNDDAVQQVNTSGGALNTNHMFVYDNNYGIAPGPAWFVSWGGQSFWQFRRFAQRPVHELGFGDFDGDGKTDAFQATGSEWLISGGARLPWELAVSSRIRLSDLSFGDFDGDGRTDVFRATGSEWQISSGGDSRWEPWNNSEIRLSNLAFGDFDGDGRTDVFRATGEAWYVSSAGRSKWKKLNSSAFHLADLALGDFNGDGKADVLVIRSPW
jgi:hypothetical protein